MPNNQERPRTRAREVGEKSPNWRKILAFLAVVGGGGSIVYTQRHEIKETVQSSLVEIKAPGVLEPGDVVSREYFEDRPRIIQTKRDDNLCTFYYPNYYFGRQLNAYTILAQQLADGRYEILKIESGDVDIDFAKEEQKVSHEVTLLEVDPKDLITEAQAKAAITKAISANERTRSVDAEKWAEIVIEAMRQAKYPLTYSKIAFILAMIQVESGFQENPRIVENMAQEVEDAEQKLRARIPLLGDTVDFPKDMQTLIDRYKAKARRCTRERDVVGLLHDAIIEVKDKYPVLFQVIPDHYLTEAQLRISTLGPMQVNVVGTFLEEERDALTWIQIYERQQRLLDDPVYAVAAGIKYCVRLQGEYGDNIGSVIGDYKAGRFSHRNTKIQMMLRTVANEPSLVVDGDLLRYQTDGSPAKDISATEAAMQQFVRNQGLEKKFPDAAIRETLEQEKEPGLLGTDLVQALTEAYRERTGETQLPKTTLFLSKGGQGVKGKETVDQYIRKVLARYWRWRGLFQPRARLEKPIPTAQSATSTPSPGQSRPKTSIPVPVQTEIRTKRAEPETSRYQRTITTGQPAILTPSPLHPLRKRELPPPIISRPMPEAIPPRSFDQVQSRQPARVETPYPERKVSTPRGSDYIEINPNARPGEKNSIVQKSYFTERRGKFFPYGNTRGQHIVVTRETNGYHVYLAKERSEGYWIYEKDPASGKIGSLMTAADLQKLKASPLEAATMEKPGIVWIESPLAGVLRGVDWITLQQVGPGHYIVLGLTR